MRISLRELSQGDSFWDAENTLLASKRTFLGYNIWVRLHSPVAQLVERLAVELAAFLRNQDRKSG